ncbi:casein kinase II regulatory subunit-domain-containing protein [Lipomyces arxii]|uniref:casein kinase II regulatory subunit-domain-containing protein n=1 Tax=Lipomyces arxii TaxID=56418 RepID=UPI0034CE0B1D
MSKSAGELLPDEAMSESSAVTRQYSGADVEGSMMDGVERDDGNNNQEGQEEEEEEEEEEQELLQDDEEESYYESGSSRSEVETWISDFCSMKGHEYFAEVSEDFIEDDFNLTGLSSQVPFYKEALDMILDIDPTSNDSTRLPNMPAIENSAQRLYGLIHARFLLTRAGLAIMAEKYDLQHFGICPRYLCRETNVLPIGVSDIPGNDSVKLYCPTCADIYSPIGKDENEVDGAYFGTSFVGMFLKTYADIPNPFGLARVSTSAQSTDATATAEPSARIPAPGVAGNGNNTAAARSGGETENTADGNDTTATSSTAVTSTTAAEFDKWEIFKMRLFGFAVSERAKSGPRMRWLRERPRDESELPF